MSFAPATAPPRDLRRVLVLGGCGSGKSTFARRLGDLTGLPVVHLDREFFSPGWVEPERDEWVRRLVDIAANERWIIDGNHVRKAFAERRERADLAILLDMPTWRCVWRVVRRVVAWNGRVRSDMAPGCEEHFNFGFLWYTLRYRATQRPVIDEALREFRGELVTLRTPADVERYLRSYENGGR